MTLMQGAHAAYYGFSAIWWQEAGYSASVVGYLWSLGVVAEIVIFALSNRLFHRWGARDLLLLSGICALVRWSLMASTTQLPWLIVAQILHCGSFTVCHLAAMRFIAARRAGSDSDAIGLLRAGDGRRHRGDDHGMRRAVQRATGQDLLGNGAAGGAGAVLRPRAQAQKASGLQQ